MYIIQSDGSKRTLEYEELNQLKKDILWIYDENIWEINCAFAPSYSFSMKYWEYLSLTDDKPTNEAEWDFYKIGSLIILLCFCVEYMDTLGGDQNVFNKEDFSIIKTYVHNFKPKDKPEENLQKKLLLGLEICASLTTSQLHNDEFIHERSNEFYNGLQEMGIDFIASYYEMKLNEQYK